MRRTWLPYIVIFLLIAAALTTAAGFSRARELTAREISVERRVAPDGTMYEIIDVGDDKLALRKITPFGHVAGYIDLPGAKEDGLFSVYHMEGLVGDSLYFYNYLTPGDTPERYDERIVAYDMTTGDSRVIAEVPTPAGYERYGARHISDAMDGGVFLGYDGTDAGGAKTLMVRRVDAQSGAVSDTFNAIIDFPLNTVAVTAGGELFALAQDSRVFRLDGEHWTRVFASDSGEVVANMTAGSDGGVYLFLISASGPRAAVMTAGAEGFVPLDLDAEGFVKLHITDADDWIAMDREGNYVASADGEHREVGTLYFRFSMLWDGDTLPMIALSMALVALVLLMARRVLLRRNFRLLPKILLILIPILTMGMSYIVSGSAGFVRYTMELDAKGALLEAAGKTVANIDGGRFAAIDWNDPYNDDYFLEMRDYIADLSEPKSSVMDGVTHNAYTSYWIYRVSNDKVSTALCNEHVVGLGIEYLEAGYDNPGRDALLAGAEDPQESYVNGIDSEMVWLAVLDPIFADGEMVAILEVARPLSVIDEAVAGIIESIIMWGLVVFAIVLLVFVLTLFVSMRTLRKLKRGALAVSGGDYTARVQSRSWDETGEIARAFNAMAESVERSVADITAVSRGYGRFVSDKLIEILGKSSVKEVRPGDYANLTASHVLLFTDSYDKLRNKDFFDALGRFYDAVIPCVAAGGGLISRYSARGFAAMYDSSPETALRSVLAMYRALDGLGDRVNCHVFLSYSDAMLGVTGNGEHLNMITVSRLVYESYAVGAAGKRFGVRVLAENSAFVEMGEAAERHRHRFIGYLRADGELRPLYDFYDCDVSEIRLKKDETKEDFERGVRLYWECAYSKARSLFVDIIKAFPQDIASREYMRLAHAGQEEGGDPKPLIEMH
ncbi:MAG: HAMP domain-containing protein [Clostridiales Family XIII bacterium]|jgi:HAMP domain-containing protein|nr:HAMP domain-containing protein [Clostridiales Family XIII bacterium]